MTPNEAKKIAAQALTDYGWSFEKLTAKTVSFSDLARASAIFVTVHGLTTEVSNYERPSRWAHVKEVARKNSFFVEAL